MTLAQISEKPGKIFHRQHGKERYCWTPNLLTHTMSLTRLDVITCDWVFEASKPVGFAEMVKALSADKTLRAKRPDYQDRVFYDEGLRWSREHALFACELADVEANDWVVS